jgi:hypothetical protein
MPRPFFHIPVFREGEKKFLRQETREAFDTYLRSGHKISFHKDYHIIAITTDYQIAEDDRDNVTPDARMGIIAQADDGDLSEFDANFLDGETLQAFAPVALAWVADDWTRFSAQAGIVPAMSNAENDPSCGTMLRHIHTLDFSLFGREFLPGAAEDMEDHISGPDADLAARRCYLNLILPAVHTSHDKIEQMSRAERVELLVRRIYTQQMDGVEAKMPMAPLDLSQPLPMP